MIISERLLFKGLNDEPSSKHSDQLFHRGHAFAVSMIGGCVTGIAIGATFLMG